MREMRAQDKPLPLRDGMTCPASSSCVFLRLPPFFKNGCFCNLICLKVSRLNFTEKTYITFH